MENKSTFFKPVVPKKITNLNWKQAKSRFPLMKPYGDADKDGLKNFRDCKPFDRTRQGFFHKGQGVFDDISVGIDDIKKLKTVGDVQRLEEDILKKDGGY